MHLLNSKVTKFSNVYHHIYVTAFVYNVNCKKRVEFLYNDIIYDVIV